MNTKQIDYCIELAHTLNFSRAAENLFIRSVFWKRKSALISLREAAKGHC